MSLDNFDISNFQGNGRREPTYIDSCINVSGPRWLAQGQGAVRPVPERPSCSVDLRAALLPGVGARETKIIGIASSRGGLATPLSGLKADRTLSRHVRTS